MPLLIGVDEAGYGPNFGPLVIAATGWLVPEGVTHDRLAPKLSALISQVPLSPADQRLWIADSKQVYRAGQGLAALERGVLCMTAAGHEKEQHDPSECWPATFRDFWRQHDVSYHLDAERVPWFARVPIPVPVDTSAALAEHATRFRHDWSRQPVRYVGARVSIIVARRFNALLRRHGMKSNVLTHVTLRLVRRCLRDWLPLDPSADIVCDKHGGRNHYAAMLQDGQTDALVTVHRESRAESHYSWRDVAGEVHWRFVMASERWIPSALASMTAKYIRELSMMAFNDYWGHHVPGIRKTAGYPTDARRFRREIAAAQHRLEVPDRWLWRAR